MKNHSSRTILNEAPLSRTKKSMSQHHLAAKKTKKMISMAASTFLNTESYKTSVPVTTRNFRTNEKENQDTTNRSHKTLLESKSVQKKRKSEKQHNKSTNNNNNMNSLDTTQKGIVEKINKSQSVILRQQIEELNRKLEAKNRKILELKAKLTACEEELEILKKSQDSKDAGRQHQSTKNIEKSLLENLLSSQALAKQTIQKYRCIEEEYSKYRNQEIERVSRLREEYESKIRTIKAEHQEVLSRQRQESQSRILKIQQENQTVVIRMQRQLREHMESNNITLDQERRGILKKENNTKLIDELREQTKYLEAENKQLRKEIFEKESQYLHKEHEFKENLGKITQKMEHLSGQLVKVQETEQELDDMKEKYNGLLEKYRLKKLKSKQTTMEWGEIFREFLGQVNRLKREIDVLTAENLRLTREMAGA